MKKEENQYKILNNFLVYKNLSFIKFLFIIIILYYFFYNNIKWINV